MTNNRKNNPIILSIVVPIYNEENVLPILFSRLTEAFYKLTLFREAGSYEIVFVNDGSFDHSLEILRSIRAGSPEVRVVNLSRNFGQTPAISAGLSVARGKAVIVMDADLQDPPELIGEMFKKWEQGAQVVFAQRRDRRERGIRRLLIDIFHVAFRFLSDYSIPTNAGVFSLIDRVVLDELNRFPERHRFLPGLLSWVGFKKATVFYDREERVAGKPSQTIWRLFSYGLDAVFSFSYKPLRISFFLGLIVSAFFFLYAIVLIILRIFHVNFVYGFTTPTVAIMFLGGIQLLVAGVLGECLGRIYEEVKQRPLYIISDVLESSD